MESMLPPLWHNVSSSCRYVIPFTNSLYQQEKANVLYYLHHSLVFGDVHFQNHTRSNTALLNWTHTLDSNALWKVSYTRFMSMTQIKFVRNQILHTPCCSWMTSCQLCALLDVYTKQQTQTLTIPNWIQGCHFKLMK